MKISSGRVEVQLFRHNKKIAGAIVTSLRRRARARREKVGKEFRREKTGVESYFVFLHPTSNALYKCRGGFFARNICFEQRAQ